MLSAVEAWSAQLIRSKIWMDGTQEEYFFSFTGASSGSIWIDQPGLGLAFAILTVWK